MLFWEEKLLMQAASRVDNTTTGVQVLVCNKREHG
jgi:hypothetical protein